MHAEAPGVQHTRYFHPQHDQQVPTAQPGAHAPIGDLVEGLCEIEAQPIPYARLPGRARTAYSSDFTCWADLADQTVASLRARPKGGEATVAAILAAARDAVATNRASSTGDCATAAIAVSRLLQRLSDEDRILLSTRVWALTREPPGHVASRLGIHPRSVLRSQYRAERRFAELLADPAHANVIDHAGELRRQMGPLIREVAIHTALRDLGLDWLTPPAAPTAI